MVLQEFESMERTFSIIMKLFDHEMAYTDMMLPNSNLSACSVRVAFTVAAYGDAQ